MDAEEKVRRGNGRNLGDVAGVTRVTATHHEPYTSGADQLAPQGLLAGTRTKCRYAAEAVSANVMVQRGHDGVSCSRFSRRDSCQSKTEPKARNVGVLGLLLSLRVLVDR